LNTKNNNNNKKEKKTIFFHYYYLDYRSSKNNRYLSSSYRLPPISVECVYGSFESALTHLNRRLIATTSPERIRGGGLLKYCLLCVQDFLLIMLI
jgi:hypothetical protein